MPAAFRAPSVERAVPRLRTALAILTAVCLGASPAGASSVRGVVHVPAAPRDEPTFQPYPGQASSFASHTRPPRGAIGDAIVFLESLPASSDSGATAPQRPKLAQKDQSFVPRVIAIRVGGEVDFPNFDPIYHNVFSVSPVRRFDLGKYAKGESRTVRFPKPGLVNVYCDIHSDMAAFIYVLPNRAFVRPRADGSWELADIPPGHYKLCWWHPDFTGGEREIDVTRGVATPPALVFTP